MEEQEENRSRWLNIRLKPDEYKGLKKRFNKTTFQTMSEYHRALLLGNPVIVIHRDKSMDEVLEELILLRRELNFVGNNLNQAVRNINSAHGFSDTRLWMNLLTIINGKLEPSITQIKEGMNKYADLWSQKLKKERIR
ncbi:plasmid mobilization protein [Mucilaginibacter sp.]